MRATQRLITRLDEGVSPVVAVILMVAITVVIAASAYVWAASFATSETAAESAAVVVAPFDADNDGLTDWVRVALARGENAPYGQANVGVTLLASSGAVLDQGEDNGIVCVAPSAQTDGANQECAAGENFITHGTNTAWDAGEVFYVPCQGAGGHQVTVSVRGSAVVDRRVLCDEAAA